jgi:hypothetical protein
MVIVKVQFTLEKAMMPSLGEGQGEGEGSRSIALQFV